MRVVVLVLPCAACFTTPPAPPCAAGAWGAPTRIAEHRRPRGRAVDVGGSDPWMSADRTHVVFSSKHGDTYNVLEASRPDASSPFGPPVALPAGPADERLEPVMSEYGVIARTSR